MQISGFFFEILEKNSGFLKEGKTRRREEEKKRRKEKAREDKREERKEKGEERRNKRYKRREKREKRREIPEERRDRREEIRQEKRRLKREGEIGWGWGVCYSTSPPSGNQVDGLPLVCHTETVAKPGRLGPAKNDATLP